MIVILALNGACCLSPCCNIRRKRSMQMSDTRNRSNIAPLIAMLNFVLLSHHFMIVSATESKSSSGSSDKPGEKQMKSIGLSEEDQRKIMMAIYAGVGSIQLCIGAIVICILGMHGACCLCPKSEQKRIMELLKDEKAG